MTEESTHDGGSPNRADAASPGKVEALIREFEAAGRSYARVSVVRREPPVSATVGDRAIVTASGELIGWIGGAACAQSVVQKEAAAALESGEPRLVGLAPDPADVKRPGVVAYPMTCHSGGTLELFVEPVTPAPRLVVVGDSPIASTLARLVSDLTYHVTLVIDDGDPAPDLDIDATVAASDSDALTTAMVDARYAVVASMGAYDESPLTAAVDAGVPYISLVASDERAAELTDRVADRLGRDVDAVAAEITSPAGIDIRAKTAEEIAVAILAEVVKAGRRGAVADARVDTTIDEHDGPTPSHHGTAPSNGDEMTGAEEETAIDPVCGMDVPVNEASVTIEHSGATYYFCGTGCADAFAEDPDRYLENASDPEMTTNE